MLPSPGHCDLWRLFCIEDLANAIRAHDSARIEELRANFRKVLTAKAQEGGVVVTGIYKDDP